MIAKFNEIATFVPGQSPESKYYSSNKGTPFMQGNRTFMEKYPFIDTYTTFVTKMANKGDVLISVRAPVGDLNMAPCDLCIGRGLGRIKSKVINNEFIYYVLKYNIKNLIRQGSGTTYDSINADILRDWDLIFPTNDKNKQNMTRLLSNLDLKIRNNEFLINQYLDITNTLYDRYFLQFEFPSKNGVGYKSSGGEMIYNAEFDMEIPKNWKSVKLKEVVSKEKNAIVDGPFGTQMKIEEYTNEGVPVYEMEQLNNMFIIDKPKHFISEDKYQQVKRSAVKNGDIIISKTGTLGLLGIVNNEEYNKGILVSRLAKITPDPSIIGKYTLLLYLNKINKSGYWLNQSTGSTMPILNNELLSNLDILLPDNDLYIEFENKITDYFDDIYYLQKENLQLKETRDYLLPLLMLEQVIINEK